MELIIRKPIINAKGESIAYSSKEINIPIGTAKSRRIREDILEDIMEAAALLSEVDKACGGFDPVKQVETMALEKLQDYQELKRYKEFMLGWFGHCQAAGGKEFIDKYNASFNVSAEKQEIENRLKRK